MPCRPGHWCATGCSPSRTGCTIASRSTAQSAAQVVLLDAHLMSVLARLVVLRAGENQLLERDALRGDEMEVLLFLDGTGRDHGVSAPDDSPHDGRIADVGHAETHRKRVAVRRLLRCHEGFTCHSHDRNYHAR